MKKLINVVVKKAYPTIKRALKKLFNFIKTNFLTRLVIFILNLLKERFVEFYFNRPKKLKKLSYFVEEQEYALKQPAHVVTNESIYNTFVVINKYFLSIFVEVYYFLKTEFLAFFLKKRVSFKTFIKLRVLLKKILKKKFNKKHPYIIFFLIRKKKFILNFFLKFLLKKKLKTTKIGNKSFVNSLNLFLKKKINKYTKKLKEKKNAILTLKKKIKIFHRPSSMVRYSEYSEKKLVFFFIRKVKTFNKGRYSRNRQTYRTGFYWCLWINITLVIGLIYYFYRFTIKFTYFYLFFFISVSCFIIPRCLKYNFLNPFFIFREFKSLLNWFFSIFYNIFFFIKDGYFNKLKNFFKTVKINVFNFYKNLDDNSKKKDYTHYSFFKKIFVMLAFFFKKYFIIFFKK